MADAIILDFESLGHPMNMCVAVSCSYFLFDMKRLLNQEYTIEEIGNNVIDFKFNIKEQIKNGRTFDAGTMAWWNKKPPEIKNQLAPSEMDISLDDFIDNLLNIPNVSDLKFFCRGVSFDFSLLESIFMEKGLSCPIKYYHTNDTRSVIDGLTKFTKSNKYIPESCKNLEKHDAKNDIIIDIIRMQECSV